jgi:hypothetical protein
MGLGAALAIGLASTLVAIADPPTFALPTAFPSAAPSPLPEIGRIRANSTACTAIRDLVIPAARATHEADVRYADVAKRLHRYVQIIDDPTYDQTPVYREGALSQLDIDTAALKRNAQAIARALGDPRLSAEAAATDPAISALRTNLQKLYDGQATRADALQEYVMRERVTTGKSEEPSSDPFGAGSRGLQPASVATPMPGTTPPPFGMPEFHGSPLADGAAIDDWARGADAVAHAPENAAAWTFATIAKRCTSN